MKTRRPQGRGRRLVSARTAARDLDLKQADLLRALEGRGCQVWRITLPGGGQRVRVDPRDVAALLEEARLKQRKEELRSKSTKQRANIAAQIAADELLGGRNE